MALFLRKLICKVLKDNLGKNFRHYGEYSKTVPEKTEIENKIYMASTKLSLNTRNNPSKHTQNLLFQEKFSVDYSTCSSYTSKDRGRHEYHEDVEKIMNQQILTEFNASYAYLAMSAFFGRTDVSLPGCQGFFYDMYMEEIQHAVVFMNYQLMRGGHVTLLAIDAPEKEWKDIVTAFEGALQLEKTVKEKITCVLHEAEKHSDHQLVDFLVSQYLKEQNESIQKMARLLTRAKKMIKDPNGEFLFDRQLFKNYIEDKNLMFDKKLEDEEDKTYR